MSATSKWIALALLGLAIAGGVAFAASRLVSEQIGIASESVSAGYDLAPAVRSVAAPAGNGNGARGDATVPNDPRDSAPAEPSTPGPAPTGGNDGPGADELEDLEKQREDELEEQLKEQEDREDEIRDTEEDRRDD